MLYYNRETPGKQASQDLGIRFEVLGKGWNFFLLPFLNPQSSILPKAKHPASKRNRFEATLFKKEGTSYGCFAPII